MKSQNLTLSQIFFSKKFLPLFVCQFIGAFADNFIRISAITLITYYSSSISSLTQSVLVTMILGLFMLPFVFLSVFGGQIADKMDKSFLINGLNAFRMLIVAPITVFAFASLNYPLILLGIFLCGCTAALFGPVKYSILPEHIEKKYLIWANGLIEAGTFVAILLGMLLGGSTLIKHKGDIFFTISYMVLMLCAGFIVSLFLPSSKSADANIKVNFNIIDDIKENLMECKKNNDVFLAILGISWFWLVGGIMMSQLPSFTKDSLFSGNGVFTMLLILFSIGTGLGSVACNRILKGQINTEYVPVSVLGMTFFMFWFWYASTQFIYKPSLLSIHDFLSTFAGIQVALCVFMIGFFGGIYIVPLYALLQVAPKKSHRSRIMAINNFMNAIFMIIASTIATILISIGISISTLILTVTIANLFTTIYIVKLLPQRILKSIAQTLFRLIYRVEVRGIENYYKAGERVLIIANHMSFLDPPLLGAFLPKPLIFAIDTMQAQSWWIKPLLSYFRSFPIDPTNPMATKTLIEKLRDKQPVVIFPEGRITVTGSLMKIYEGPGLVADKSKASLLPIRIDGAQFTPFSRLKGKVKIRLLPSITITIMEPQKIKIPEEIIGRQRRHLIGKRLYEIMSQMMFEGSQYNKTLFEAMLDAKSRFGGKYRIVEDADHKKLSYNSLVIGSIALGGVINKKIANQRVGIFLPNAVGTVVTFFALQLFGKVPAMLNYSSGLYNILACCKAAAITDILTSKRFVEKGEFYKEIAFLEENGINILFLEEIRVEIAFLSKLKSLFISYFPKTYYAVIHQQNMPQPKDPAVILFTSGSEGKPKGVVLSHSNIEANIKQGASCIDFAPHDIVFNALPVFHSFGLTGGMMMPILSGVKSFFYPSPLHYRIIPEMIYGSNATILYGTDTFLIGYARNAHPYDFFSIRYVFAGAEKLRDETRMIYSEKFGIRIMEAYGVTEASPGIAINTPMHYKKATVGKLLPGIDAYLEAVPGINKGGRLIVSGANVMLGYLKDGKQSIQQPEHLVDGKIRKGWHDTGDIVDIDEEGYVTILGRVKRFAKIAGEMISLSVVEEKIEIIARDFRVAAVSLPDNSRGEIILVFTDNQDLTREMVHKEFKKIGLSELYIPKQILFLPEIPILATGKVNYVELNEIAMKYC